MILVHHRKARAEYEILDQYQAGIVLSGAEVKSLRNSHGSLHGSFVKVLNGELYLMGAQISPYPFADNTEYDPMRSRKLLLKKKEIYTLIEETSTKGKTLIPLALELKGHTIKLNFAVAKGKKAHDRRAEIKKRDIQRDIEKETKQKVRW